MFTLLAVPQDYDSLITVAVMFVWLAGDTPFSTDARPNDVSP